MSRAYSNDLRERVVFAVRSGETCRAAAARFEVSVASVVRWSQRHRETGSVKPCKLGGYRPWLLAPYRNFIAEQMKQTPHLTVSRLQKELAGHGVCVCRDTVWRFLHHEGLSFKKKPTGR